ncbi:peptide/nickel transport system ATP-binding protein [Streptomyces zhaozhouensis]|uniref:Peptide/nickel transport system ATP-binding protein n=1 Tax=Streptomyces zhaozhouensis TaxID=1300267 RepID=A0A286DUR9_9ACTN|nr:ABC transporter ATP-binding protein [Streptomyces zhaozhouensis]SOD62343.1 peptide/nickel transport system ATP-binding protein [Streptomyces zhaozhouensis]
MPKSPDPPSTATSPPPDGEVVLEARAISKHFAVRRTLRNFADRNRPVVHAVDDVSLKLRRGSVTAVVGESGSGKSTIARLLAQLYPTTSGELLLHGKPTRVGQGRAFRAYCRQVQLIFQDPFGSLNPTHTVRYHLTRALRIHDRAGRTADDLEKALAALLERVHLTPPERYLDSFPHELSGGQRQRVAIARAMAADPAVLLADEPVSMLDVSIRLGILNLLRDLKERLDLAILYITHDIASARYFADETLVMYAGRMVEGGDSETVTQRPAHPYTQLLTSSAPDPDRIVADAHARAEAAVDPAGGEVVVEEEESETAGEPPSLISPPSGCRFHPRCPKAMERCASEVPPRFDLADGQWAACWLYAEDAPEQAVPREASA